MSDNDAIQVGDILEWSDNMASPHRWKVLGIHLGAVGQESLIEMESITHRPGWTGEWEHHPIIWAPEVLCRHLRKIRKGFVATQTGTTFDDRMDIWERPHEHEAPEDPKDRAHSAGESRP